MLFVRKAFVFLLSVILFLTLLAGALAFSISIALSHPEKLESWLSESGLYSNFVSNALNQAGASQNTSSQSGGVSLSNPVVKQAAESTFSPTLLQSYADTILNSNYAWLEGKTPTPAFSINLSSAKATFAQNVGQYAQAKLESLPVCTKIQALSQPTSDPLSLTCRPSVLNPAVAGEQVTQQLLSSNFLNNTVITASNLSPSHGASSQPYYEKLSFAPKIYGLATKLPWVIGAFAALCAIGIIFTSTLKRRGLRHIGIVLILAGLVLMIIKFAANDALTRIESMIFNKASIGPLQSSLTIFAHKAVSQLVSVDMYFGAAFIFLAIVIFLVLIFIHRSVGKPTSYAKAVNVGTPPKNSPYNSTNTSVGGQSKPSEEVTTPNGSESSTAIAGSLKQKPKTSRRLIQ
jgi:hypothetical protein